MPKDDRTAAPLTASRPPRVLLGGLASVRLLVHVILAKYLEHMPLHRQEQSFKMRYDVEISRKTMGGWIRHVAEQWLVMIYESIKSDVRSSLYLNAIIYTVVLNCKYHGFDPRALPSDVLERLPLMKNDTRAISALTPKNWSKLQQVQRGDRMTACGLPLK